MQQAESDELNPREPPTPSVVTSADESDLLPPDDDPSFPALDNDYPERPCFSEAEALYHIRFAKSTLGLPDYIRRTHLAPPASCAFWQDMFTRVPHNDAPAPHMRARVSPRFQIAEHELPAARPLPAIYEPVFFGELIHISDLQQHATSLAV
mmetsp:Transcript_13804/g.35213  ORF Transcript_13804/g.35213 Transcript_13804/m.35213 type:complete len:152 (-) Transcript_13804:55-510(-)|eukprot:CAMPEP_0174245306 /NCGR_PEP_ID=MMETSP0417-20130205/38355_1 /TAXON_ID=242541 /ORGANISM="Mayorella sp, Strain BSH-02190019" /LENGTH=151 /DNA_ID=CAMNT_0015325071 /DNA_START=103 /DNA_END=558 /DNA_ORIENTATION=-